MQEGWYQSTGHVTRPFIWFLHIVALTPANELQQQERKIPKNNWNVDFIRYVVKIKKKKMCVITILFFCCTGSGLSRLKIL